MPTVRVARRACGPRAAHVWVLDVPADVRAYWRACPLMCVAACLCSLQQPPTICRSSSSMMSPSRFPLTPPALLQPRAQTAQTCAHAKHAGAVQTMRRSARFWTSCTYSAAAHARALRAHTLSPFIRSRIKCMSRQRILTSGWGCRYGEVQREREKTRVRERDSTIRPAGFAAQATVCVRMEFA